MAQMLVAAVTGSSTIPAPPEGTQSFDDIDSAFGFYNAIEWGYANGLLSGFKVDNTYRAANNVTRGQMASFMYRAFIAPAPCVVVLGGPAITKADPSAGPVGWTSETLLSADDPGNAYVVLDAVRLGPELAGTDGNLDITFTLASETQPTQTATVSLNATDITAAHDAALASGDPYLVVSWDIPAGLASAIYTLSVTATDENDVAFPVNRTATYVAGTPASLGVEDFEGGTLPAGWTVDTLNSSDQQFQITTFTEGPQPECTDYNVGLPLTPPSGQYALCTWAGAHNPTWGEESGDSQVTTAAYDCSGLIAAQVSFKGASFRNDSDTMEFMVSADGGATWTNLLEDTWINPPCDGTWGESLTYDISSVAAGQSDVRFRWTFLGNCCMGWIIDDVEVTGVQ